jgi:MoaA/NifB/PqqE/SkfB family radical SAM enzyme
MSNLGWRYLAGRDKEQIVRGVRDGVAYGGPYHVEIYPADRCNIDCFFCSTATIRGTDELPLPRFEELLGELVKAGTRAIRFAGGGEPLFHRRIKEILRAVASSGIRIENVTTNAVLLEGEVASLLMATCDEVTVSLNTGDAESYARMMRTPARNFDRVLKNVRALVEAKRGVGRRPSINLQFLIWRENYRDIPKMYELARDLDVDTILFSGLAYLSPEQRMSDDDIAAMLRLYEDVIRLDEFRRITNIGSFERDIHAGIEEMVKRLAAERARTGPFRRALNLLTRNDYSLAEKLRHHLRMKREQKADRALEGFDEACVIGWYSMVVRSDGTVAPCCILQGKPLGNIFQQSIDEIWHGEPYQRFRTELSRIIHDGQEWTARADDQTVESVCGSKGTDLCPMKSFYFNRDTRFVRALDAAFAARRGRVIGDQ